MNSPEASLLDVRVAAKTRVAQDICTLDLVRADGRPLPPAEPGAHIDLHLPSGRVRPYSLCQAPGEPLYRIGVLRDAASRGGSREVHDEVQAGQTLRMGAPRQRFGLAPQAEQHLLLAAGIGITPLLSMAQALQAQGRRYTLHYAARSRAQAAFLDLLGQPAFAPHTHLYLGDAGQRLDLAAVLSQPQPRTHVALCGPQRFIDAALACAQAAGWPSAQLHFERFGAEAGASPPDPATGNQAFEVELARSGRVIPVAADQTIARALAQAGMEPLLSCEQGVCGTCLTPVLAGEPDHRDSYLTPEERVAGTQILLCCSRARGGRLVLDL